MRVAISNISIVNQAEGDDESRPQFRPPAPRGGDARHDFEDECAGELGARSDDGDGDLSYLSSDDAYSFYIPLTHEKRRLAGYHP